MKQRESRSNARVLNEEVDPTIVLYAGDDSQDVYQGYVMDNNDQLIETNYLVDEDYAQDNEVWVVSINERDEIYLDASGTSGGTSTQSNPSAIVDQIKCKCHKESWTAGASEVHIITITSDYGFYNYDINVYGNGDYEGGQIYKFSRKDVKNERNMDVDFYIAPNWDGRAPGMPWGHYVIFEYDTWPTAKRRVSWIQANEELGWDYRSADDFYDAQTVYKTDFGFHTVNNGCIEWQAQYH